jgi:hypothetical protein
LSFLSSPSSRASVPFPSSKWNEPGIQRKCNKLKFSEKLIYQSECWRAGCGLEQSPLASKIQRAKGVTTQSEAYDSGGRKRGASRRRGPRNQTGGGEGHRALLRLEPDSGCTGCGGAGRGAGKLDASREPRAVGRVPTATRGTAAARGAAHVGETGSLMLTGNEGPRAEYPAAAERGGGVDRRGLKTRTRPDREGGRGQHGTQQATAQRLVTS